MYQNRPCKKQYLYQGLHGHNVLVPWMWLSLSLNVAAFFIYLIPKSRNNIVGLNVGAFCIIIGVWIEKGPGFVAPGFIPDPLGEIYEYFPNFAELAISLGIWACGLLVFTLFMKVAIPIVRGDFIHSKYAKVDPVQPK